MSQLLSLSPEQLQKRSKELDAREVYLATREQLAETTEKAIAKGQYELALLDSTILARELITREQNDRLAALEKEYIRKGIVLQNGLDRKQIEYDKLLSKVSDAKLELVEVCSSIAERHDYSIDQEKLISKQAEDGNLLLRGLEYEIIEAKQVVKDLKTERTNVFEDKDAILQDLEDARSSFLPELEQHQANLKEVTMQIADENLTLKLIQDEQVKWAKQVTTSKREYKQLAQETQVKVELLDTKEREIMAKREALRVEREEMEEAKHYFQDPKSLYGTI